MAVTITGQTARVKVTQAFRNTGRDWAEADVEALYADVTPRQLAAVELYSALIPGVVEVVADLRRRGIKPQLLRRLCHAAL